MKTQLKIKFMEILNSGNLVMALRVIAIFAVLITSLLFPEVALAGPNPGIDGG